MASSMSYLTWAWVDRDAAIIAGGPSAFERLRMSGQDASFLKGPVVNCDGRIVA